MSMSASEYMYGFALVHFFSCFYWSIRWLLLKDTSTVLFIKQHLVLLWPLSHNFT